ncbi:MAG: xylulokinase [Phycisphaerales bacterium]|nr:xylulokinase [Phycisphaerales bacterium]
MFIGADIGTSSTKVVAVDRFGRVVAQASSTYDFDRPQPGWSEQDPSVWWRAACQAMRQVCAHIDARSIQCVGLSGQMHGSVFLDAAALEDAGRREVTAIRPALMWNDQRTATECQQITQAVGSVENLVHIAGNAPLTGFTLPKILWLRAHEPPHFARLAAFCMPKDFIRLCLTGMLGSDVGDAAGTLLLDVDQRIWSTHLVRAFGLDPSILPPVVESGAVVGQVLPWASVQTGIPEGTPVIAGSGDNQCGGVGAGVVEPGTLLLTLGTSGVVYAHSSHPLKDLGGPTPGRVHTMCSATGNDARRGAWTITGCMLSAAGSLEWARSVLAPGATYDDLMNEAARVAPGCDGLLFMPHLTGERCPYADPQARGGWIGLTRSHSRAHLVRSVIEGVCLGMAQVFDLVTSLGIETQQVRIGGGGARSPLWRQILADCIGHEVFTVDNDEGPAFGAALLAGSAVREFDSIEQACAKCVHTAERTPPGPARRTMQQARARYDGLYPALRATMHAPA